MTLTERVGKVLGAWCDAERESAWVVLTAQGEIAAIARIAIGQRHQVAVPIPEVVRPALLFGARTMLFAHSHPSGNLGVSTLDVELTRRILDACAPQGITLTDHVLVAPDGRALSMVAAGMLEAPQSRLDIAAAPQYNPSLGHTQKG